MDLDPMVLWEDSSDDKPANYGPHAFLVACLADAFAARAEDPIGCWYERRRGGLVESNPRGGVDKLLADLTNPQLYRGGRYVVAVVDGDRIRERVRGSGPLQDQICARAAQPAATRAFVLERNSESLIRRIRDLGGSITDDELERACHKKELSDRDKILGRFADAHDQCDLRARVCQRTSDWTGWPDLVAWLTTHLLDGESQAGPRR